jgi:hypothetical protein
MNISTDDLKSQMSQQLLKVIVTLKFSFREVNTNVNALYLYLFDYIKMVELWVMYTFIRIRCVLQCLIVEVT